MLKPKNTRIFKVTMKDGSTYYNRMTTKSLMKPETFLKNTIAIGTFHKNNPHIHVISDFEKSVIDGNVTLCEIVYDSLDLDNGIKLRDSLIESDKNCMNFKKSLKPTSDRNMKLINKVVKKEFSKALSSMGKTIYYISKEYGLRKGWKDIMDFTTLHPIDSNFCKMTLPLTRV